MLGLIATATVAAAAATANTTTTDVAAADEKEAMTTLEYLLTEIQPMLSNEDDCLIIVVH